MPRSVEEVVVQTTTGQVVESRPDFLAVEEPLEIRLICGGPHDRQQRTIAITMRTPGHDEELAAGFLLGEGLVRHRDDILSIAMRGPELNDDQLRNVVRVELRPELEIDWRRLERHFFTTSSCGVCGKTSLSAVETALPPDIAYSTMHIAGEKIHDLPQQLRSAQAIFAQTGGLHAAGLFDTQGQVTLLREDVGRHNAVDKLFGTQFLAGKVPLAEQGLLLSGRVSFELMQKALMAGVAIVVAVGAPSTLAVNFAQQFHMTLVGFVRNQRYNIYCGGNRILPTNS